MSLSAFIPSLCLGTISSSLVLPGVAISLVVNGALVWVVSL